MGNGGWKDRVDLISKILLGVASIFATYYFGKLNLKTTVEKTQSDIQSTNVQRVRELISLFETHIDKMGGADPAARSSYLISLYAARELKKYGQEEFSRLLSEISGTRVSSSTGEKVTSTSAQTEASAEAAVVFRNEYLQATELANSHKEKEDKAAGGYFSVMASFPLTQLNGARDFIARAESKLSVQPAEGVGRLRLSIYQTAISHSYAVVLEEKAGCPLPSDKAYSLTSLARANGLASDAFTQRDRSWVLVYPQGKKGAAC